MQPVFEHLPTKKLIGKRLTMSFLHNKTGQLWGSFMPRRKEINHRVSTDLFSLQVYDQTYFQHFNPEKEFEKWALAEVANFDHIPDGFEPFELAAGLYAIFTHKGPDAVGIFQYIFGQWLPHSDYDLDDRPHFELLGEKYKNGDPESEETIWIPVKPKQ